MSLFKQTGWRFIAYQNFVDVFPLDDLKEHATGDECWCVPKTSQETGCLPMVSHNSADGREESEPDHWEERYRGVLT
jgi:hypothetical protein